MKNNYPIKPRHLDTKEEPKGFDNLLDYGDRGILWAFVQFWQAKGNWEPFTHEEFIVFISNSQSKVNTRIKCGICWFVGPRLHSIISSKKASEKEGADTIYAPTHLVISTYFLWNPSKKTCETGY